MENILGQNIRFLRKSKGLTQNEFALKTGINRANVGSYEEGRAEPKIPVLLGISVFFGVPVDDLITSELWKKGVVGTQDYPRILSVVIDDNNNERILLVPDKASAGYTKGYADPEYIEKLPAFSLPLPELRKDRTYRIFQINGESMLPIPSGTYIIGEFISSVTDLKNDELYVMVTRDNGIVFKRYLKEYHDQIILKSDNPQYKPFTVFKNEIIEIWKASGYISFDFQGNENFLTPGQVNQSLEEIKKALAEIKNNLQK